MTALYILFPLHNTSEIIINSESNTNAEQYFLYVKLSHRCISVYFFQHQSCLVVYAIINSQDFYNCYSSLVLLSVC